MIWVLRWITLTLGWSLVGRPILLRRAIALRLRRTVVLGLRGTVTPITHIRRGYK